MKSFDLKAWILERRIVLFLFGVARKIKPWGFEGLSLYYVAEFFIEAMNKGSVSTRAAAIAFRLFISIFPALIVLLSLIPIIPIDNFQESLFSNIQGFFPGDTFTLFESTLHDLINRSHSTILSIGFILALYFSSDTVNAILQGFNASFNLEKRRTAISMRLLSLLLLLILTIMLVISVGLITFSEIIFYKFKEYQILNDSFILTVLDIARWLIIVMLIYGSISILYNTGDLKRSKWKSFNAGSSFATIFFVLASLAFAWFVQNFASYNRLYGSLGTLLVLLVWMNFNCFILLLGFELNTSISRAKRSAIQTIKTVTE